MSGKERRQKEEKLKQDLVSILLDEGQESSEAKREAEEVLLRADHVLRQCSGQKDLEETLASSYSQFPVSLAVMALAQFDIDEGALLSRAIGSYGRNVDALRYIDLWYGSAPSSLRQRMLPEMVATAAPEETESSIFGTLPGLSHVGKLLPHLSGEQLEGLVGRIVKNRHMLSLISSTPLSAIPERYQEHFRAWYGTPEVETDAIVPVTRDDLKIGACSYSEIYHQETLLDLSSPRKRLRPSERLGRVALFYVQGELIGSMKMKGERSILGLATVRDSRGRHPVVPGGVYATTSGLTEIAEENSARAAKEDRGWAKVEVDELPLLPLRMLGHSGGYRDMRSYRSKVLKARERIPS